MKVGNRTLVIAIWAFRHFVTRGDVRRAAARGAPRYLNVPGLLRKNYWLGEDGMRAGGIYVWESKARAEGFYTPAWRQSVTAQDGVPPEIVHPHSPVMADNTAGRIVTNAEGLEFGARHLQDFTADSDRRGSRARELGQSHVAPDAEEAGALPNRRRAP
jgi:hypothetical protein